MIPQLVKQILTERTIFRLVKAVDGVLTVEQLLELVSGYNVVGTKTILFKHCNDLVL
jgi:hypothetical protein